MDHFIMYYFIAPTFSRPYNTGDKNLRVKFKNISSVIIYLFLISYW